MSITKISPDVVDFDAGITISTADNLDTLTLTSTDADANAGPNLRLYRNSSSPADSDALGFVEWEGRNDNSQDVIYGQIAIYASDVSDGTEDSNLYMNTIVGGTVRNRINAYNNEVVINEESIDSDFRVESDSNTHAIFLEASSDKLGIGVSSPIARLSLPAQASGDSGIARFAIESAVDDNDFMISQYEDSSGTYTLIGQNLGLNSGGNDTILDGGHRTAAIRLDARGSGSIQFLTGGTNSNGERARILSGGGITFNGDTATANALDDYEEGTFTPGIGEGAVTIDRAHYTKIGRLVHFAVLASGFTNRTSSNQVVFHNLPFPVLADHACGTAMARYNDETNAQCVYVTTNESIMFYAIHTANYLTMSHNDLNNTDASIYFFGTYTAE